MLLPDWEGCQAGTIMSCWVNVAPRPSMSSFQGADTMICGVLLWAHCDSLHTCVALWGQRLVWMPCSALWELCVAQWCLGMKEHSRGMGYGRHRWSVPSLARHPLSLSLVLAIPTVSPEILHQTTSVRMFSPRLFKFLIHHLPFRHF